MRCTSMVSLALLVLSLWTPVTAAQDADDCIDVRGAVKARIHNRCSYPVNVAVCCEGQGRLANCQNNNFESFELEGNSSKFIAFCDGWIIYGACKAPYHLQEYYWDPSIGNMRGGPCVLEDRSSATGGEEQTHAFVREDMRNSDLAGAQMHGMNLYQTDLSGSDLENADLASTNLFLADLTNTNCRNAIFKGANMQFAKLIGADLTNADLAGANMNGAHTRDAIFCNTTMPDGTINNSGCR